MLWMPCVSAPKTCVCPSSASPCLCPPFPYHHQIIGCVGTRMRSHHAHTLLLGIMITQLDRAPPVRALAAEALLGELGGAWVHGLDQAAVPLLPLWATCTHLRCVSSALLCMDGMQQSSTLHEI